jgi:hypothetical protein
MRAIPRRPSTKNSRDVGAGSRAPAGVAPLDGASGRTVDLSIVGLGYFLRACS